ncbi:PAS domain-containing protein [Candidatus Riflebacteria bacterium]
MSIKIKKNQKFNGSQQLLKTVLDAIEGVAFVKDTDGIYQFVNSAFSKYFSVNKNEVIGKNDYFIFPSEVASQLQKNDKRIIQSKTAETVEESGEFKGIFFTYRTNKVPLIDEDGEVYGICGIGFDVTQQKKLEEEREKLITQLQKALTEIKTLRGILPLCSFCKKIRDDKGYWEQVDVYIHQHTEADISHGVCPECMKEHYPEVYERLKK